MLISNVFISSLCLRVKLIHRILEACMDHDRAEGEGVAPQEYTAIKIELLASEWTSAMQKSLKKGSKVPRGTA